MILSFRTSTYARDVYLYGNRTLQEVPTEYVEPIKKYAGETFSNQIIENALSNAWISQQEYDETIAYKEAVIQ